MTTTRITLDVEIELNGDDPKGAFAPALRAAASTFSGRSARVLEEPS